MSMFQHISRRSLLAGVGGVAAAAVAGCGGGGGAKPSNGGATSSYTAGSASLKVQLGKEIEGVLYPEGYIGPKAREFTPFSDGSTTFRVVGRQFPDFDLATNAFSNHLEQATGMKVDYETIPPGDDGAPKLNAIITSGDLPDAFMTGPKWMGGFSRSQLWAYGRQGLFMDLNQLVDEYMPEMLELFKNYPKLREVMTTPDGTLFALPAVNQCYHCKSAPSRTWIHTPIAEEFGVAATNGVETIDDFEKLLRDIKAAHPDVTPLSGFQDQPPIALVCAAFCNMGFENLRRVDGKPFYTPLDEKFRDAMAFMNKLVKDGLTNEAAFTQTKDQLTRLGMDPEGSKVGLVAGQSQGDFTTVDLNDPNSRHRQFVPFKPFKGPDGKTIIGWSYDPGAVVGLIIPTGAQKPEEIAQWADYQLGLVSTLNMRLGPDNNWAWATEGEKGIDERQAIYKVTTPAPKNGNWWEWCTYNLVLDVRHGEAVDDATSIEPELYRAGKMYEPFAMKEEEFFLEPFFDETQAAEIGELRTNIDNAYKQGMTNLALGNLDPEKDADWETYKSSLEAAGVPRYLEILEAADKA